MAEATLQTFGLQHILPNCIIGRLISILFSSLSLSGCSERMPPVDTSTLVVTPGFGVTNLCEINMTPAQIGNRNSGSKSISYERSSYAKFVPWREKHRYLLVPSLGAIIYAKADDPVTALDFYARPYFYQLQPDVEIRIPFRGRVGNCLSFFGGDVSRLEVESCFGKPLLKATNTVNAAELYRQTEAFCVIGYNAVEELVYPSRGITFVIESNVVTRFEIYKAR